MSPIKPEEGKVKRMNLNVPLQLHSSFKATTAARGLNMTDVLMEFIKAFRSCLPSSCSARIEWSIMLLLRCSATYRFGHQLRKEQLLPDARIASLVAASLRQWGYTPQSSNSTPAPGTVRGSRGLVPNQRATVTALVCR